MTSNGYDPLAHIPDGYVLTALKHEAVLYTYEQNAYLPLSTEQYTAIFGEPLVLTSISRKPWRSHTAPPNYSSYPPSNPGANQANIHGYPDAFPEEPMPTVIPGLPGNPDIPWPPGT